MPGGALVHWVRRMFDRSKAPVGFGGQVMMGGAAAFVMLGLWLANDVFPGRRRAPAPLRYALTILMILVLATVAIPLLPLMFGAALLGNVKEPD
jgi:hypothetical protein